MNPALKIFAAFLIPLVDLTASAASARTAPDFVVAQDGSGDFSSVQAALGSISKGNTERKIVLIKSGTYGEHIRLENSFLTLLGEDRLKTRIVWKTRIVCEINERRDDPNANADRKGGASFNLGNASGIVIENLTSDNHRKLGGKPIVVISSGTGTRIVIQNADMTLAATGARPLADARGYGRVHSLALAATGASTRWRSRLRGRVHSLALAATGGVHSLALAATGARPLAGARGYGGASTRWRSRLRGRVHSLALAATGGVHSLALAATGGVHSLALAATEAF